MGLNSNVCLVSVFLASIVIFALVKLFILCEFGFDTRQVGLVDVVLRLWVGQGIDICREPEISFLSGGFLSILL